MATQIIVDTAINSAAVHVSNALHLLRLIQKANRIGGEEWTAVEQAVEQLEDACNKLEGVDRVARLTGSAATAAGATYANPREGGPEVESEGAAADGDSELPAVTILVGDLVDTIYGIHGISEALRRTVFDNLEGHEQSLLMGLSTLAERAKDGLGQTTYAHDSALKGIATVHG
jgi:hypothetical protein